MADVVGYLYALSLTCGGIIGYITKGSVMSGLMGLIVGCISGIAAYRSSTDVRNWGLSLTVSFLVTVLMGTRYLQSGKFMPPGLVALMSILMVCRYGYRAFQTSHKEKS